ncbi:MAG TPA: FAD/NAD(P)-binding oxidoreductase [Clostridiales bacterium]|nr:FAD/NAD(P)-binding oxidoreductase [Clostridiales bacterium]
MKDALIIGAGVVGGLIARELTRQGLSVTILEKMPDVAMGATRANSAIVHAGFDAKEGSLKARLNVRGSEMMEKTAEELGVRYRRCGSLVVAFSEEEEETLRTLLSRGERNGVKGLKILSRAELLAMEPNIGDGVTAALYAPSGAIVCPYELCIAAVGCAMDNGAELHRNFEVTAIEKTTDGYRLTSSSGESVTGRLVINCAGAYSDEVAKMAGAGTFTVHPRKGEYLLLDRECGDTVGRTIFRCPSKMGKGILVTPTVDGNLLLGPTAEDIGDKEDTATNAAGLVAVRRLATEQVRGIDFRKIITSFSGLRSVGSTGDFIIDMPIPDFVNVAAIESPGLTSAPAIAEYVTELLEKAGWHFTPKEDFNPRRTPSHAFRDATIEEKNRMIATRPDYAHIVCRCETVSEGEIVDAIRRNPGAVDIDGVKRRTRATMGRCQGGFCTPYIAEILSRELGIPYEEVTKSGGASRLNVGRTK